MRDCLYAIVAVKDFVMFTPQALQHFVHAGVTVVVAPSTIVSVFVPVAVSASLKRSWNTCECAQPH